MVRARLDHLVYATPDLARGIAEIEKLTGIEPTPGGQHPGRGTHNALISLGDDIYLEIIGPDPDQPNPTRPRSFGIDDLTSPRLVTWAARATNLDGLRSAAATHGVALGPVRRGARLRPDGVQLAWHFTDPRTQVADGIVPFFIDWDSSPHPAGSAAQGAKLVDLRAEHPEAAEAVRMLAALGLPLPVTRAERPALVATIEGPRGRVELR